MKERSRQNLLEAVRVAGEGLKPDIVFEDKAAYTRAVLVKANAVLACVGRNIKLEPMARAFVRGAYGLKRAQLAGHRMSPKAFKFTLELGELRKAYGVAT